MTTSHLTVARRLVLLASSLALAAAAQAAPAGTTLPPSTGPHKPGAGSAAPMGSSPGETTLGFRRGWPVGAAPSPWQR